MLEEVSTFLEGCSEADKIALLVNVFTPDQWLRGQEELRSKLNKDPSHFRRPLHQSSPPISFGRTMMGWLWFWHAVDAAWARRIGQHVS